MHLYKSKREQRKIAPHPASDDSAHEELDVLQVSRDRSTAHEELDHDVLQDNRDRSKWGVARVGALAAKSPSPRSPDDKQLRRASIDEDRDSELDLYQLQKTKNETEKEGDPQSLWEWLLAKREPPPLPWEQTREYEIKKWIADKRKYSIVRMLFSEDNLYNFVTCARLRYFGDRDEDGKKDGR
jgi:hypothetical protein